MEASPLLFVPCSFGDSIQNGCSSGAPGKGAPWAMENAEDGGIASQQLESTAVALINILLSFSSTSSRTVRFAAVPSRKGSRGGGEGQTISNRRDCRCVQPICEPSPRSGDPRPFTTPFAAGRGRRRDFFPFPLSLSFALTYPQIYP